MSVAAVSSIELTENRIVAYHWTEARGGMSLVIPGEIPGVVTVKPSKSVYAGFAVLLDERDRVVKAEHLVCPILEATLDQFKEFLVEWAVTD